MRAQGERRVSAADSERSPAPVGSCTVGPGYLVFSSKFAATPLGSCPPRPARIVHGADRLCRMSNSRAPERNRPKMGQWKWAMKQLLLEERRRPVLLVRVEGQVRTTKEDPSAPCSMSGLSRVRVRARSYYFDPLLGSNPLHLTISVLPCEGRRRQLSVP